MGVDGISRTNFFKNFSKKLGYFNVFQQAQWIGLEGILRLKALVYGLSMKMPSPSRVFLESFEPSQCPGFQHGPIIHSFNGHLATLANQMAKSSLVEMTSCGVSTGYPPIETASQVEANRSRR